MPIHLNYQGTTCKGCGAEFIAYQEDCQCPQCEQVSDEFCNFAAETIASMKDHKQIYGNYFPDSWFAGSVADLVQGIIFELFDNIEAEKPNDATAFISDQLTAVEWEEENRHLAAQAKQIAYEVFDIYSQDQDFRGDSLKEKPIDPKLKNIKPDPDVFDNLL